MTETCVVCTDLPESSQAGEALGHRIWNHFGHQSPDALIVFASTRYQFSSLLQALAGTCHPRVLVGCSSAGEFTSSSHGEGQACAMAIWSDDMQFAAGLGRNISQDGVAAAHQIVTHFRGVDSHHELYHAALLLTDALAGHAEELIDQLTLLTGGAYQFFGGGAGDDAHFRRTEVFCGLETVTNAAVSLEILSKKPLGVGVQHGWVPASAPMRVTASQGTRLISLNAMLAVEVLEEHAQATGQHFDRADPMPFFLHNIIGIDTGRGHKLRVPLALNADGSLSCAAEIPTGATVRLMATDATSAAEAASIATREALQRLQGHSPAAALFFDCVATRLRTGREFGFELQAVQAMLGPAPFAGCNTYGQVARAEGQFSGFHNCTAVVCVIPA